MPDIKTTYRGYEIKTLVEIHENQQSKPEQE